MIQRVVFQAPTLPQQPEVCYKSDSESADEADTWYPASQSSYSKRICSFMVTTLMKELNDPGRFPVVIYDNKHKLEVHITDPKVANFRGSDVLKLSMKNYVERLHQKKGKVK